MCYIYVHTTKIKIIYFNLFLYGKNPFDKAKFSNHAAKTPSIYQILCNCLIEMVLINRIQ